MNLELDENIIIYEISKFEKSVYLAIKDRKNYDKIIQNEGRYKVCEIAAQIGHLELLKYAHETKACFLGLKSSELAALHGNLDCLDYCIPNTGFTSNLCVQAAKGGHVDCLVYLNNKHALDALQSAAFAAFYGKLECLRYVMESGFEFKAFDTYSFQCIAAMNDRLDCLKYLFDKYQTYPNIQNCPSHYFINMIHIYAAFAGSLDCCRYIASKCEKISYLEAIFATNGDIHHCIYDPHGTGMDTLNINEKGRLDCKKHFQSMMTYSI